GPARADIYFGAGDEAASIAGRMRHNGRFVMLVPRSLGADGQPEVIPLPRPRPAIEEIAQDKTTAKAVSDAAGRASKSAKKAEKPAENDNKKPAKKHKHKHSEG